MGWAHELEKHALQDGGRAADHPVEIRIDEGSGVERIVRKGAREDIDRILDTITEREAIRLVG